MTDSDSARYAARFIMRELNYGRQGAYSFNAGAAVFDWDVVRVKMHYLNVASVRKALGGAA